MIPAIDTTLEEFDALARTDLNVFYELCFIELHGSEPYLDNFHVARLCSELEQVRHGRTRFLAIAQPPRSGKSLLVNVAYQAWILGHKPDAKIMAVSYGAKLSEEHAYLLLQILRAPWYQRLFPRTRLKRGRQAVDGFETTEGGKRYASSFGGSVTGFGADLVVIDDPTKPSEALSDAERQTANLWFRHTLIQRPNNKATCSVIVAMQRLHEDDLIGHLMNLIPLRLVSLPAIAQEDEEHVIETPFGTRRHIRLKGEALHPERESLETLDFLRTMLGEYYFSAQYLQMPSPPGGGIVKAVWFQRFDLANPPTFDRIIQSWDTANKSNQLADFTVGTTWGLVGKRAYLLHVLRKRLEFPELLRLVPEHARLHGASKILIEDCASGVQLARLLRDQGLAGVESIKPLGDKGIRMRNQTPPIENGFVFLPTAAPWLDEYLHELAIFPAGRYDDQVDSTSQALQHIFSPDGFERALATLKALQAPSSGAAPMYRLNHPDKGMLFLDIRGHRVEREADGSFLVEEETYRALRAVPGMYVQEE